MHNGYHELFSSFWNRIFITIDWLLASQPPEENRPNHEIWYIYIYIYIYCHPQADSFVVSQLSNVVRPTRCFNLISKPGWLNDNKYLTPGLSSSRCKWKEIFTYISSLHTRYRLPKCSIHVKSYCISSYAAATNSPHGCSTQVGWGAHILSPTNLSMDRPRNLAVFTSVGYFTPETSLKLA